MKLSEHDILFVFTGIGVILLLSRLLGDVTRRFGLPALVGELLAGLILGPSLLGAIAPEFANSFFPRQGPGASLFQGLQQLALLLFIVSAGTEIHLASLRENGRAAAIVSLAGILVPFAVGFSIVHFGGEGLRATLAGPVALGKPLVLEFFFGTALAISALPVIAKTLMDLGLYRSRVGVVTMAAAVIDDVLGWMLFAGVLRLANEPTVSGTGSSGAVFAPASWFWDAAHAAMFVFAMLVPVRAAMGFLLRRREYAADLPSVFLSFAVILGFFAGSVSSIIGLHMLFGAFLAGIALGDSEVASEEVRMPLDRFARVVCAPIFFGSIGLKINFVEHFDLGLTLLVIGVACIGKIVGCGMAARLSGLGANVSWCVGIAMNSRGAMEIILGLAALEAELINQEFFVALVVMALVTSFMTGPAMKLVLKRSGLTIRDLANDERKLA